MSEPQAETIPREDKWAYTPEMRERVRRALAGKRSYRVSEEFLLEMIDAAERAGGTLQPEAIDRLLEEAARTGKIELVESPPPANGSAVYRHYNR
jgi:hypothetical protein